MVPTDAWVPAGEQSQIPSNTAIVIIQHIMRPWADNAITELCKIPCLGEWRGAGSPAPMNATACAKDPFRYPGPRPVDGPVASPAQTRGGPQDRPQSLRASVPTTMAGEKS